MKKEKLYLTKISTGVPGLDDLFYGGLRLPDPRRSTDMDGICIIIQGKPGVAKSDLAIQIMRGTDKSLSQDGNDGNKLMPFFCTLNHRTEEWKRKYRGLEVMEAIENAKFPSPDNDEEEGCKLCLYYKDLQKKVGFSTKVDVQGNGGCTVGCANTCKICKMLRQEVITYNPRGQSLHWNVGGSSNNNNLIASLLDDEDYIEATMPTADIFPRKEWYGSQMNYTTQSLSVFKEFQKDMHKKAMELESKGNNEHNFKHSAVVLEGFSIFDTDTLKRLQYDTLIDDMRKVAAVSILVFDERAVDLNFKSDIIIEMRKSEDERYKYQYRELQIVKCNLHERIRGWHRYSTIHDMKVQVFPKVSAMMAKRFSKENSLLRIEHSRLDYPLSLLDRVGVEFDLLGNEDKGRLKDVIPTLIDRIMEDKNGQYTPWEEKNTLVHVDLINDSIGYDNLFYDIKEESSSGDATVLYILLGKSEQELRRQVYENCFPMKSFHDVRFWQIDTYYTWPEIVADSIKKYVNRWVRKNETKKLHMVIDDFQYINQYPFLEQERMFVPALVSICDKEVSDYRYKNVPDGEMGVQLSLVCMSESCRHYRMLKQMAEINK